MKLKRYVIEILVIPISLAIAIAIWRVYKLELALSFLTLPVAFLIAKWYGDVAGAKAAREYEEKKAAQARIVAFKSLLNQIAMIRALVTHNAGLPPTDVERSPLRLPVTPFEMAFLSSSSILFDASDDSASRLLDSVIDYLRRAHAVNTHIEVYLSAGNPVYRESVIEQIKEGCTALLQTLDTLEGHLRESLLQVSKTR